jgi:nitrite reductase/ring-hydroxylating ferredoxin subunit
VTPFALCTLDDIPDGGSKGFQVDVPNQLPLNLFVVRQQQKLYVYRNRCPHMGIPLEWVPDRFLDSSGTMIQCAGHAALFVINSGKCVAGPCAGRKLEAIPFYIDQNTLFITPPDAS